MSKLENNEIDRAVSIIYHEVRYNVGKAFNGAIVPAEMSRRLAGRLSEELGRQIDPDYFVRAFWLKEVPLYLDADIFLKELGKEESIVSVVYTQGEVFDHGEPGDTDNHGYQNHKIEVAGIPWYFSEQNRHLLQENNLDLVHGHFYKTAEECLRPLLAFAKKYHLDINFFADLEKNHEEVGTFFKNNGVNVNLYWLNRNRSKRKELSVPVREIESFKKVNIKDLLKSLVLLDLDGTLIDNLQIRTMLHDNVMKYTKKLQEQA